MSVTTPNDEKLSAIRRDLRAARASLLEIVNEHEDDREYRDDFIQELDRMALDLRVMLDRLRDFK